ncbi:hypothetical protein L3Q82_017973%2C partial [Scomber scombrus]|uniref:Uncharacterized protein n=1 Tax=Scomber scombrus TaxID=13677 RepID=A0AAV1MY22_SCOSC
MCSSGSTCSSYVNASVREEFPSVPHSARHLNDDKCATRSGNIESYQDIYQVCSLICWIEARGLPVTCTQSWTSLVAGCRFDACKHICMAIRPGFLFNNRSSLMIIKQEILIMFSENNIKLKPRVWTCDKY